MREVQRKTAPREGHLSGRAPVHGGKSPGMRNRDPFVNLRVLRGLLLGYQVRLTDLRSGLSLLRDALQCRAQHGARTGFLHEDNYAEISRIGSGVELDANILDKALPFLQA